MSQLDQLWGAVRGGHRPRKLGVLAVAMLSACAIADPPAGVDDTDDLADGDGSVTEIAAIERAAPATPGAAGIGDPLFPTLGNGGYDVEHYDLDLRYETAEPSRPINGTVRILARATQSLSQLNLDFAGASVGAVCVDGRPAAFRRDREELVIKPRRAISRGEWFVITVTDFVAIPHLPTTSDIVDAAFFITPDGTAWAGQPDGTHQIFPSNDHPGDMASFSFRIDVPEGTTAVASGVQTSRHTARGRSVYRFEQRAPMATELAQVVVGDFAVISRGRHAGVTIRDVVPTRLAAELGPKLAAVTDQLDWMEQRVGDYPFPTYGSLVVDAPLGFALETQTLSLYETGFFIRESAFFDPIMVHELAHQWFGDSVAPAHWADVWQNEGHATWYQLTFQLDPDSPELADLMQQVYSLGDIWRTFLGPVANPAGNSLSGLFNPNVYYGGALTLFALRQQIGDAAFQQLERTWVTRYRGRSASTADFIALASQIAGRDLTAFLDDWLYGTVTPVMPGHQGWTVDPVDAGLAATGLAAGASVPLKGLRVIPR